MKTEEIIEFFKTMDDRSANRWAGWCMGQVNSAMTTRAQMVGFIKAERELEQIKKQAFAQIPKPNLSEIYKHAVNLNE